MEKIKITKQKFIPIDLDARLASESKSIVEIRDLNIIFGKRKYKNHAVKNFSLNIHEGEILGLVGESGSGKSTIGNSLVGLMNIHSGSIKINDTTIPNKAKKVKRSYRDFLVRNVQMIFQDPASSLNPYKKVYKVIEEGLKNVDIKDLFLNLFNEETISTLFKILSIEEQENVFKCKSVQKVLEQLKTDKLNLNEYVGNQLYQWVNSTSNKKAINYLDLRQSRKEKLFSLKESIKDMRKRLILDITKSVGLSEMALKRYPLEFSGGQQQRVGISRAIILKPKLLIADEPISALDVSIQAQVINLFNDLKTKYGLTFLFIAHDLRMVEYISDRIAVMYKGQLLEIGPAKEVIYNAIHPYTKSLIGSVPSINIINESLRSIEYDPSKHNYSDANQPGWFQLDSEKGTHFVFGTKSEMNQWSQEKINFKGAI